MVKPGASRIDIHNKSVELLVDLMVDEGLLMGDKNKIIEMVKKLIIDVYEEDLELIGVESYEM